MKKEIKFTAKLDTDALKQDFENVKRKLKELETGSGFDIASMQKDTSERLKKAGMGGMSNSSQEQYQRSTVQYRRELDQFIQKEVQAQAALGKEIAKRADTLGRLKQLQDSAKKGSDEELKIQSQITEELKQQNEQQQKFIQGNNRINQGLNEKSNTQPAGYQQILQGWQGGQGVGGKIGGAMGGLKNVLGGLSPGQLIGGAFTAAGAGFDAIGGAAGMYNKYQNFDTRHAGMYGNAQRGLFGDSVNSAYNGRSAVEMAWLPEKNKALRDASAAMNGQRVENNTRLFTDPLSTMAKHVGAGIAGGATIGGIGGAIAGLGVASAPLALAGGTAGAVIGGIGGLATGTYSAGKDFFTSNKFNQVAGTIAPGSKYNKEYEGQMLEQFGDNYQKSLQGYKDQNPYKNAAAEQYNGNYMRYLDFQRSTGTNFNSFHGRLGFRSQAMSNGFTDDQAMGASGEILGAGGSTDMARKSVFGLQAARSYNLNNSSKTLGTISSSIGDGETSKQAYIKMIETGMRSGLDSSKFAEENRKFMDLQAGVIASNGTNSQSGVQGILDNLSGFLANKTSKGIESAGNMYQKYNQAASRTQGGGGVLRSGTFLKDDYFGQMDPGDRAAFLNIEQGNYDPNGDREAKLVDKYKHLKGAPQTGQELVDRAEGLNRKTVFNRKSGDDAVSKLEAIDQKLKDTDPSSPEYQDLLKQQKLARGDVGLAMTRQDPSLQKSVDATSFAAGTSRVKLGASPADGVVQDGLNKVKTDKIEDESVRGAAEASAVVLRNFIQFKDQLVPAAEAIRAFHKEIAQLVLATQSMDPAKRAKYLRNMADAEGFTPATNQATGGKPKSGGGGE